MKAEQVVLEVMQAISASPWEYRGNFDHLTRDELFQFLLSPRAGIYAMLPEEAQRIIYLFDTAYEIAVREMVLALQADEICKHCGEQRYPTCPDCD